MSASRITLRIREKRTDLPNFRDYGMMVDRPLLRLVRNLQRLEGGYALVSERSLRAMIHQDTQHLPGVDTLRKAMVRLEALGYIERRWIHRGCTRPDGGLAEVGCLRLRVAVNRGQRRAIAARAHKVDHRESAGGRVMRSAALDLRAVAREMSRGAPDEVARSGNGAAAIERQREIEVRLREFEATLSAEERYGPGGKRDT